MRESFLIRIAADPPARVWSGIGSLRIPADAVEDEDQAEYHGAGALLSFPDLQQLINSVAERVELSVSGVNAETLKLAIDEAASVQGAQVAFGTIRFDDDWQPIWPVTWENFRRADTLTPSSQSTDGGRTRSLSLSLGSDDTARSTAPVAFFTDADQRRRSPTDAIFDHVAGISQGTTRRFGPSDG